MKRYVAFLRGINVSGKNKIAMSELKACFEEAGYSDIKTYLNSGNVVFSCSCDGEQHITTRIEELIKEKFKLEVPVFVISEEALKDILRHAPEWWGNDDREVYDNLIFILKPTTFQQVYDEIGEPKTGLEQIQDYNEVIFWSFNRKNYQKTNWWSKTASAGIGSKLTIRTAGTVRKICGEKGKQAD